MLSEEAKQWIESAERDRTTVEILLQATRIPYEIVAFHCQQCAEKYIKSVFIQHSRKTPFVHDLLKLNRDIQDICPSLKDVEIECEKLTPFGTATRYPGSTMQPSAEHMPHVAGWMETIRDAVLFCLDLSQQ